MAGPVFRIRRGINGGGNQANFLAGLGKAIRKAINIAGDRNCGVALYGAILVPFAAVTVPAAAAGAVVGGFIGLIAGIDRCMKGNYVCLFSCI
jgi:hypothetical protein